MLITLLVIAAGGALGSVFRFLVSSGVESIFKNYNFPAGILVCNILGSLMIGFIAGFVLKRSELNELWRYFLVIGLCGGFTTFSSFSLDTITLFREGAVTMAFVNIIGSVVLCLCVTYLGMLLASMGFGHTPKL